MLERRLVYVAVSFEFLIEMMTAGWKLLGAVQTVKGLPKDAQFITSRFDEKTMSGYLLFSHESFKPVEPGHEIPIISIHMKRYFYDSEAERALSERIAVDDAAVVEA
jgi:hypothetical protein